MPVFRFYLPFSKLTFNYFLKENHTISFMYNALTQNIENLRASNTVSESPLNPRHIKTDTSCPMYISIKG